MAIWAIGDIQGCYRSFKALLAKIEFDPNKDRLWIAGDLVNRGEGSLETLEYLYSIRESVQIVLGNHDLLLIAAYYGIKKSNPTIDPILSSPHAKMLIDWLRRQKILHVDHDLGYCMAHAGISPDFDLDTTIRYAKRMEKKLKKDDADVWLKKMFEGGVDSFNEEAKKKERDRYSLSAFTRMRFCDRDHRLDFVQKGSPSEALRKKGLIPWFKSEKRKPIVLKIIFGHWSTLGFYEDENVLALDTGCLWGGSLSAARIDVDEPVLVLVECNHR